MPAAARRPAAGHSSPRAATAIRAPAAADPPRPPPAPSCMLHSRLPGGDVKTTSRPRTFRRRRMCKTPYTPQNLKPLAPAAAARIADGFPLSAVGRPRRHGLRSRCFTASQRQDASLHGPFPSADARQNRDECPCACLCPTVPARPHACLSENRFHKRKRPPSSKRAPQTSAGGKTRPLSGMSIAVCPL